jgi:hypothetical protein
MSTQEPLPRGFEEQARQRFGQIANPEVTVDQYVEFEAQHFRRQRQLESTPTLRYQPGPVVTPCGNGDFEADIATTAEWQGGYGSLTVTGPLLPPSPPHPFTSFTGGIYPGPINNTNSHQTWGGTGADPNVGIPLTAPGSSQHAVRIGNAVNGYGCELLSKTFTVTAAQRIIKFWYAVVLQDPKHPPAQQPFFWVRVSDSADNEIPGAVNLGNGTGFLVSDSNNPFFQTFSPGLLYKTGVAPKSISRTTSDKR